MNKRALLMDEKDNVVTVIDAVQSGDVIAVTRKDGTVVGDLKALEAADRYHKLAYLELEPGDLVTKYGQTIGRATCAIKRGEYAHVHNIESVKTND